MALGPAGPKKKIISPASKGAYHGRGPCPRPRFTGLATITGFESADRRAFYIPGCPHFNLPASRRDGESEDDFRKAGSAASWREELILQGRGPTTVAAFIAEAPFMGAGAA